MNCFCFLSLSDICVASSKKVLRATHRTVRSVFAEHLPMVLETNHRAGSSCRQPNPRNRWCCRLLSWMATQRLFLQIRLRQQRSCVNSWRRELVSRISLASLFTLHCSTRFGFHISFIIVRYFSWFPFKLKVFSCLTLQIWLHGTIVFRRCMSEFCFPVTSTYALMHSITKCLPSIVIIILHDVIAF